jgi:RNA polymerase sigma-70 factor (sigma-E family)
MAHMSSATDEAFEAFLHAHASALGRLALHLTGGHDSALDLVQDVLVGVLRSWDKVARADHQFAYVRRMMINLHLNSGRKRTATSADPKIATAALVEPDRTNDYDELDAMWRALRELSARQRTVLVLRYYEGCSDEEIAAIVGCRRTTVRSLAARGLATLRNSKQLTVTSETSPGRLS